MFLLFSMYFEPFNATKVFNCFYMQSAIIFFLIYIFPLCELIFLGPIARIGSLRVLLTLRFILIFLKIYWLLGLYALSNVA